MITVKYLYQVILIIGFLTPVGCINTGSNMPLAGSVPSGSFNKVAILLPGPTDGAGWSQAGYEGLQLLERELGAQVAYTTNVSQSDAEQLFRRYAAQEFDFIIGHGGQYVAAAEVVADEFPRTKFAVVTRYAGNNKNLGALSFRDSEVLYLAGVVAALKTKTNRVGFIGGEPYAHLQEQAIAFEHGAKAINPSIEVFVDWVQSWDDPDKAREIAGSQIENGVDVLDVLLFDSRLQIYRFANIEGSLKSTELILCREFVPRAKRRVI